MNNYAVIIPTLNGGDTFKRLLMSFREQICQPYKKIVIDSGSDDHTVNLAQEFGFEVISITRQDFNHGATRQMGINMVQDADMVVFLTQDAILAHPEAVGDLLNCFDDSTIGAAYGRQIPHKREGHFGAHARLFNYPPVSAIKAISDSTKFGIKTAFISNSFAAYRRSALLSVGGFPTNVILGEDTYVAAKMLLEGWKVAYCSESMVYHSHGYGWIDEFRRYFDIGVFHTKESWLRESFGKAEGEGVRFVLSELQYLYKRNILLIPSAILRTAAKLLGYRLGLNEKKLPLTIKHACSMHKAYWL